MSLLRKAARFKIKERNFPWVLLGLALLTYGVMIQDLGFYWDDWEILYLSSAAKTPGDIFLFPFRPLHVLLDIATVRVLGFSPLPWHLLLLLLRYLGGLIFWKLLQTIWPDRSARNAWAALLFLVYPSFLHQSMSVVYRQHFSTALLYLVSVWLMALAVRARQKEDFRRFWAFFVLSLASGGVQLFITEYFAALELWRPFLLWAVLRQEKPDFKSLAARILLLWFPYLIYTVGYFIWRVVYVQRVIDDPNQTVLLDELRTAPIPALLAWLSSALLDLKHMLLGSWLDTLTPELFDLGSPVSLVVLALVAVSGIGLFWLLRQMSDKVEGSQLEGVLLGLAGVVLGLVPAWLIGRNVFTGRYDTRFSIPALAGVSLLMVSLLFSLVSDRKKAAVVLAIAMGLAIGRQVHMTNEFRWDWERQLRTYWQVHWRAPELDPGTAVLVNRSVSGYATTYPIGYALNLMYNLDEQSMSPDYWWFEVYERHLVNRVDDLLDGAPLRTRFHNLNFDTDEGGMLVFNLPGTDEPTRCVWLLSPADEGNDLIAEEMRQLSLLSNLNRFERGDSQVPPTEIFGPEPDPTWCSNYQQTALAAQYQDWEVVNALYQQTVDQGMSSNYGHEYLPYIAGGAAVENWDLAADLTLKAYAATRSIRPSLCADWEAYGSMAVDRDAFQAGFERVNAELTCVDE
jgi:hypothetical protein